MSTEREKWKVPHLAAVLATWDNVHIGEFQRDCSSVGLSVKGLRARRVTGMYGEGGGRNHREWQGLWSAAENKPYLKAFQC